MPRTTTPRRPQATARRFRSGMRRRFGFLYHASGLGMLLRLRLEEHSAEHIRRATAKGPVVYIMHTRSRLDWLALNRALNGRRLPLPRFTNGLRSTLYAPLGHAFKEWGGAIRDRLAYGPRPNPIASGWLTNVVAAGMPTALFLLAGRSVRSTLRGQRNRPPDFDPIPSLLEAQEKCPEPIQVVPVVVSWQRRPGAERSQAARFILGSQDEPGPLQKLFSVATRNTKAVVQAGIPIDLTEVLERFADEPPDRRARRVRLLLRRYLYRENQLISGPRIRSHRWTRRLVSESPEVRALIASESARRGKPPAVIRAEVDKVLDHIAARMRFVYVRVVAQLLKILWNRIYAGVDLPEEDMDRLRESFRDATPILIPCHRSHLDYLLISSTLFLRDMVLPHVVAGENLSFWPAGAILRRLGGFFIKRSFGDDQVFPVVFQRYLHQLMRDGFPVEFFIEGGRSRTGKLLPPRLGVLKMVMQSATALREGWDVNLVPIGISYEQIAERNAYRKELGGDEKKAESLSQMVRASNIFGKRFGRVYVRVGEPIRVSEIFAKCHRPWSDLSPDHQHEIVQHTGERVMYRIAQNMVMLPSGLVSMALLAQSRSGIRRAQIEERVERLYQALRLAGAQPARSLEEGAWGIDEALTQFEDLKMIQRLQLDGEEIIQVVDDQRISLEYHKNSLLHFLAPMSMMAAAIRSQRNHFDGENRLALESPAMVEIRRLFASQVFWLRYEFVLDPEHTLQDLVNQAIDALLAYGALSKDGEHIGIADRDQLIECAELTRNFVESTQLTLKASRALRTRDLTAKDLPRAIHDLGQKLVDADEMRRPEALSLANLKNSVRAFREEGVIQIRSDGGGIEFDMDAAAAHETDLDRLLG